MMFLITGQPGNGKTLRAMWVMQQEYERNAAAVKAGKEQSRRFFSNIAGSTVDENPDAFPWVERMPEDNDWTKLPDGSFVVYDECHADGQTPELARYGVLFPSTGKPGESSDPRIRAMSTHRHRGFDMVFMTQYPNKVHHNVRSLLGSHTHMNRSMGLAAAGVLTWSRVQIDPYDERQREKAEEEIWKYPKELYKRFLSSSLHTSAHKFKVPKKVWGALSTLVAIVFVCWGVWSWAQSRIKTGERAPEQARGEASLLAPAPAASVEEIPMAVGVGHATQINTVAVPTLAGVVASERGCRAFNTEGFQIDMSERDCRRLLEAPLPFNVFHEFKAATGSARPEDSKSASAPVTMSLPGNITHVGETANVVEAPEPHF